MSRRSERSDFVKASERRIWRITAVSVLAIVGMTLAVLALLQNAGTVARLSDDEDCLRSVVAANSERSTVLSQLGKRRTDADIARQAWNTREQQVFDEALHQRTAADAAKVRHDFTVALHGYLRADARYRRLNTAYNQAAQAHPVPKLHCTAGRLDQPAGTVTASTTTTAHATSTATSTQTRTTPGPTSTVTVTATRTVVATRTVTKTVTATVTVAPGKQKPATALGANTATDLTGHGHRGKGRP